AADLPGPAWVRPAAAAAFGARARSPADRGLAAGQPAVHGRVLRAWAAGALPIFRDAADLPGAGYAARSPVAAWREACDAGAGPVCDRERRGALGRRSAAGQQAVAAAADALRIRFVLDQYVTVFTTYGIVFATSSDMLQCIARSTVLEVPVRIVAMIMAGGEGTRLSVLSEKRAKPSVPFAGKFRIIDFPLSNCVNSGIFDAAILTQYRPHSLNNHIGNGKPWDLDRSNGGVQLLQPYQGRRDESWYKGTADAVFQNLNYIRERRADLVVILSGD